MKLLVASLCLSGLPVFAQDAQNAPKNFNEWLQLQIDGRILRTVDYPAAFRGNLITQEGALVRLRGEVEVETESVTVRADQAVYHKDSGEIEAAGNVRITRIPPK